MRFFSYFFLILAFFFFIACGEGVERLVPVADNNDTSADTGDSGDTADTGDSGDTADTGDSGDTADTGDSGDTADTGDSGDTADTGDSGDTTDTGDSGDSGDTGDTTDTGDTDTPDFESICVEADGTWDGVSEDISDSERCYKIVNCKVPSGENAEYITWRIGESYTLYYDFDENKWKGETYNSEYNDTDDAKICQYICTSNATREDGKCKPYCSVVFDGENSKIEVDHNDLLNLGQSWTIEAWVKQEEISSDKIMILKKGSSYNLSAIYKTSEGMNPMNPTTYYNLSGGFSYKYNNRDNSLTATGKDTDLANLNFSDGWDHIALSHYQDGVSYLRLYVNGELIDEQHTSRVSVTPTSVADALTIGYYSDGNGWNPKHYYFKGKIDQLKISTKYYASDAIEVSKLSVDEDTIAFWDFNGSTQESKNNMNNTPTNISTYSTDCAF